MTSLGVKNEIAWSSLGDVIDQQTAILNKMKRRLEDEKSRANAIARIEQSLSHANQRLMEENTLANNVVQMMKEEIRLKDEQIDHKEIQMKSLEKMLDNMKGEHRKSRDETQYLLHILEEKTQRAKVAITNSMETLDDVTKATHGKAKAQKPRRGYDDVESGYETSTIIPGTRSMESYMQPSPSNSPPMPTRTTRSGGLLTFRKNSSKKKQKRLQRQAGKVQETRPNLDTKQKRDKSATRALNQPETTDKITQALLRLHQIDTGVESKKKSAFTLSKVPTNERTGYRQRAVNDNMIPHQITSQPPQLTLTRPSVDIQTTQDISQYPSTSGTAQSAAIRYPKHSESYEQGEKELYMTPKSPLYQIPFKSKETRNFSSRFQTTENSRQQDLQTDNYLMPYAISPQLRRSNSNKRKSLTSVSETIVEEHIVATTKENLTSQQLSAVTTATQHQKTQSTSATKLNQFPIRRQLPSPRTNQFQHTPMNVYHQRSQPQASNCLLPITETEPIKIHTARMEERGQHTPMNGYHERSQPQASNYLLPIRETEPIKIHTARMEERGTSPISFSNDHGKPTGSLNTGDPLYDFPRYAAYMNSKKQPQGSSLGERVAQNAQQNFELEQANKETKSPYLQATEAAFVKAFGDTKQRAEDLQNDMVSRRVETKHGTTKPRKSKEGEATAVPAIGFAEYLRIPTMLSPISQYLSTDFHNLPQPGRAKNRDVDLEVTKDVVNQDESQFTLQRPMRNGFERDFVQNGRVHHNGLLNAIPSLGSYDRRVENEANKGLTDSGHQLKEGQKEKKEKHKRYETRRRPNPEFQSEVIRNTKPYHKIYDLNDDSDETLNYIPSNRTQQKANTPDIDRELASYMKTSDLGTAAASFSYLDNNYYGRSYGLPKATDTFERDKMNYSLLEKKPSARYAKGEAYDSDIDSNGVMWDLSYIDFDRQTVKGSDKDTIDNLSDIVDTDIPVRPRGDKRRLLPIPRTEATAILE